MAPSPLDYETLFHNTTIDLLIPSISTCPERPDSRYEDGALRAEDDVDLDVGAGGGAGPSRLRAWWSEVQTSPARDIAFFGKLRAP